MAQMITSQSFVTSGSAYAESNATNFPASNAYPSYTYPNRPWKSVSAIGTTVYWAIDPGATADYTGYTLVLDNCNFTACTIWLSKNSDFSGLAAFQQVTLSQDGWDGRYKLWYSLDGLMDTLASDGTVRYIQVKANTTSTTDGGTAMQIGSGILLSGSTSWTTNFGFPYEVVPMQAVQYNDDFVGGGREPAQVGNRYCQIILSQSNFPSSTMKSVVQTLAGYGESQPFVFFRNYDASSTQEVYVVRRVGPIRASQATPTSLTVNNVVLEEVV